MDLELVCAALSIVVLCLLVNCEIYRRQLKAARRGTIK